MLPDLTLRLDALTTRAHRSLEIATRFPQLPPGYDRSPSNQNRLDPTLATAKAVDDTGAPRSGVAAFEVFPGGRISVFGDT